MKTGKQRMQEDLLLSQLSLTIYMYRAFLIGSLIQLYESLDKRPVTVSA